MTSESPHIYEFDRFRLDAAERTLWRGGEPVALTPKVFGILLALVEQSGHVVQKDELMRQVWPDSFVEEGNLTQNVSLLRKALGETADGKPYIETVARRGYRFVAGVTRVGKQQATEPKALRAVGEMATANAAAETPALHAFAIEPLAATTALADGATDHDGNGAMTRLFDSPSVLSPAANEDGGLRVAARPAFSGRAARWTGRRIALVAGVALLALVSTAIYFSRASKVTAGGNLDSIAVLPFVSDAGDAETEFLTDRLAENLINNLAQLPKLRVVPRSLSLNYKGSIADLQKVGRELGARAVLTGRIHRQGDTLSIQADLIDVANVSQVWGRHYDRKIADLLLVPEDISKDIFENLRLKLSVEEKKQLEANRYYLLGRNALNKRTAGGLQQGIEYFQKAIDIDSDDAAAYAGLADCYNMLVVYGIRTPKDAFPLAQEAALKALELDDNLAEAHTSLAFIKHRWNWERQDAEREFQRAIKDKPSYGPAHQWYSSYLVAVERKDEAIAEAQRAAELDPLSFSTGIHLGWIYYMAGRYEEAIAHCQKLLAVDAGFFPVYRYLGLSYEQKGMYKEAIAAFERGIKLSGSPLLVALLGHAYAVAGNRAEAVRVLGELQEMAGQRYVSPYTVAAIYAGLRDNNRAYEWLEKAIAERDIWLMNLRVDPVFKEIRADRRFKAILLRIGLIP